jgi:hypothetical protein
MTFSLTCEHSAFELRTQGHLFRSRGTGLASELKVDNVKRYILAKTCS